MSATVAVLGIGGIGGMVSALLWRSGCDVTCIAKEEAVDALRRDGLTLESAAFGTITARPAIVTRLEQDPDVLIIATKATTLREALRRAPASIAPTAVIVPLLNGIEHLALLRSVYGPRVAAAVIGGVEAFKRSSTRIVQTTASAQIELASDGEIAPPRLTALAEMFTRAGFMTMVRPREAEVMWGKLVRINALACTTSASGKRLGEVRSDPWWRAQLEGCLREGVAVAAAEGVVMDAQAIMTQIDGFSASLGTSMQRDIDEGRPSELDAIAGAVVRAGRQHGIACPITEGLMAQIPVER